MTREERNIYNYNLTHKIIDSIEYKQCSKCKDWFPLNIEYFYLWKHSTNDGYRSVCKICDKEKSKLYGREHKDEQHIRRIKYREENLEKELDYNKKWRDENREHISEYTADYFKNNPDKVKIYGKRRQSKNHKISKQEWLDCKNYFNNNCAYCGIPLDIHREIVGTDFHKEHGYPNGADDLSNCLPSCESCNCRKWEYDLLEWYNPNNPRFTQERYDKIMKWLNEDYKNFIQPPKPKGKYVKKNIEYWNNKSR
jgi:hypothetical protein